MRELSLDQVKTLISIIDLGTFSAAARALHLSQPTISLHISELEQRIGAPLLIRGSRRVMPTAAGSTLAERGRRILRDADLALEAVRQQVTGNTGSVRLGTSTGIVVHLLPQVLETLEKNFPQIEVEVSILGSTETMARLTQGTLDIGLVATPQKPGKDIVISHWRSDPMMAFVPARWNAPKRITPAWLAEKPLIFNDATTHMYHLTMDWFAAAGHAPRGRIELNYNEAMKSLVAAGYGAALLPMEHLEKSGLHPQIQILPVVPKLMRHIGIAHRRVSMIDGATRNLLHTLGLYKQTANQK
ncbi:LysR family transcriptional regulator [Undibacterium sp. SXout7W]|uniref:LysR family transcriptional regulator n=1 Tax=Undibacterium sp. SXout7W TaxID=3413049 RepID=UPI003BF3D62C